MVGAVRDASAGGGGRDENGGTTFLEGYHHHVLPPIRPHVCPAWTAPSVAKAMGLCLVPLEHVPGQSAPFLLSGEGGGRGPLAQHRGTCMRGTSPTCKPILKNPAALTVPGGALSLQGRGCSREAGAEWIRVAAAAAAGGLRPARTAIRMACVLIGKLTALRRRPCACGAESVPK